METVIVLGASYYKFKDEGTGEIKEGGNIHYVSDYAFTEADKKGMFPIKVAATAEIVKEVLKNELQYPAWCELSHVNVPNGKGVAQPKLVKVKYLKAIKFDLNKA